MNKPLAFQRRLDGIAIGLSGLCLIHCLALPVLATALPALAAWAEAEWVHALFAALAVPLSGWALWRAHRRHRLPARLVAMAAAGLGLLLLGAAEWPNATLETPITVAGASLLAGAHAWNLRRRHAAGACPAPD